MRMRTAWTPSSGSHPTASTPTLRIFISSRQTVTHRAGWFKSRGGNYLRCAILGYGHLEVRRCIEALRDGGYDGCLHLEFEGMEDPMKGGLGIENLKKHVCE